jgi:hypothetical protein
MNNDGQIILFGIEGLNQIDNISKTPCGILTIVAKNYMIMIQ